ncbi:SRPBCC domain-containing protein [Rhodococcus coprophilus]|uniref:Activator of Hsp90 ATPase homolog 1-like protein n=1 Tax=Rhodococcus coprophilus TaxID=38310 RepID=A0A2X4UM68_9NOCA|nr:SRPBCC domain-containing protein [Rhodococcus coprophilus]MBM7459572.1 hypothetical protein [Rhodococcus coprophilus]SQI36698.1 Activator of Hsp90 ATPase homolog 1-like protein [Rhodococcus coprophilus]
MDNNLTLTFSADRTPEQMFAAINDVQGWWSGEIDGTTDRLGAEFTYRVADIHYSKFRITELTPSSKVTWLVLDSYLSFVDDKEEWTGTTVDFDLSEENGRTRVRFTHTGLVPESECYDACVRGWSEHILGGLKNLVTASTEPSRPTTP